MNTKTTIDYLVKIPNDEGTAFVDQVTIKVPAEIDSQTGELILGNIAQQLIEEARLKHMGLLTPTELKALRQSLGLTQSEMAEYLQAGQKSYTRWELGYGRQSRLVNNFLLLLKTGKINLSHLRRPKGMATWNRVFHSQHTVNRATIHSAYKGGDTFQSGYSQCEQLVSDEAVAA